MLLISSYSYSDTEKESYLKALSAFDVEPLNSPVKTSIAKFLLKLPPDFSIDEVTYKVRNASRIFETVSDYRKINLVDGPLGKELQINVSKLAPGFYQLFVKIKDRSHKEHQYKNKYKDHAMFTVDESLEVPMPNEKINDKTIAGIDSDGDGIRDDIQRWINEEFSTQPKTKMAMKQVAMGIQAQLLNTSNSEQSIITTNKFLNDLSCLSYTVGLDQKIRLSKDLISKTLNTKDRHYAKIKASANFSGQSWVLPKTPEEEKSLCSFNPDQF